MNNIEIAITKAMKSAKKDGSKYYVYATYYKVVIARRAPPFGAAHWIVTADGFKQVESEYTQAKNAA